MRRRIRSTVGFVLVGLMALSGIVLLVMIVFARVGFGIKKKINPGFPLGFDITS